MRIKLIAIATALVAIAVGVTTSHAALQNAVSVSVKFKKAGGPGSLSLQLINMDDIPLPEGTPLSKNALKQRLYDGGKVPERVAKLIVQSKAAQFNSKSMPYCKVVFNGADRIPTRSTDPSFTGAESLTEVPGAKDNTADSKKNCPKSTLLGKGDFTAVIGTPGQPYDPANGTALEGTVYVYNYKPRAGDKFAVVARLKVENPVPANQYLYSGVDKKNVLRAVVPNRSELPPNLDGALPPGEVVMTSLTLNLTAPKPKKKNGKPVFTIKSFSNLDVYGQLVRE